MVKERLILPPTPDPISYISSLISPNSAATYTNWSSSYTVQVGEVLSSTSSWVSTTWLKQCRQITTPVRMIIRFSF
ncbi:hypothetical protein CRG98_000061 [Punica granatum]|uniref:Uncharacterized protein n=1 Tax=Punica granatum TaxID=22663 RepID=A0A2I0LGD9_PUNGR|nr:hypothetical protein CRG98_000061 [Punica granatum]